MRHLLSLTDLLFLVIAHGPSEDFVLFHENLYLYDISIISVRCTVLTIKFIIILLRNNKLIIT